jgi:hypothetical protein
LRGWLPNFGAKGKNKMKTSATIALLFAAMPLLADNAPVINKVEVTPSLLIILGTNFGVAPPTVTVCGASTPLVGNNFDTQVAVTLPVQAKKPGTCLLKLVNNTLHGNDDKRTVTFNVTIPTSQRAIAFKVDAAGHLSTGNAGVHSARFAAGSYEIDFTAGTWEGIFPPAVVVVPVKGLAPNLHVSSYDLGIDGGLILLVENAGVDIEFFMIAMQS